MKKFKFTIDGNVYEVSIKGTEKNVAEIEVNGTPFTVEIERERRSTVVAPIKKAPGKVAPVATPSKSASTTNIVKAQLPGSIVKVSVEAGQKVNIGDVLLTMESMKMENNIVAEYDGIVKAVIVQAGQAVMQGDGLVEITGNATEATPAAPITEVPAPPPAPNAKKTTAKKAVKAQLPGSILKVLVKEGQTVKAGETLLTMESMKMENNIIAEYEGVVTKICVQAGDAVMQDELLIDME